MNTLIEIAHIAIHQDQHGRFSLNDLHKAAGGQDRHRPSRWTENQHTQELIAEIESESGAAIPAQISHARGVNQGTYVCKDLVYAYATWISAAFYLKVIRTFDSVMTAKTDLPHQTLTAIKLFTPLFRIAKLIGCDKNAAAISANQAVHTVVGTNVLALLGHTHLKAENQDGLYFTPTQLGQRIGVSGKRFNLLLIEAGLQFKQDGQWHLTDSGKPFGRIYDTGKHHQSSTPVQQTKWTDTVLALVKQQACA